MASYDKALLEAEQLSQLGDDALILQLGLRVKDRELEGGEERAKSFSGDFAVDAPDQGAVDFLRKVGRDWWRNLQPELMGMVCNPDSDDLKKLTGSKSVPQVAAGLAMAAVTTAIAAPPAWVIVAATIVATKLADTGLKALCQNWADELKAGQTG